MATFKLERKNLLNIIPEVEDRTPTSPDYFKITELPSVLTSGKNTFRFVGKQGIFVEGSTVEIEILDVNSNPVYYETYIDTEASSKTVIVSIFVQEDTAIGVGAIILCATIKQDKDGKQLRTDRGANLRWIGLVEIDRSKPNKSDISFIKLPTAALFPATSSYVNPNYVSGSRFLEENRSNTLYAYYNNTAVLLTSSLNNTGFITEAVNANVTISGSVFDNNLNPSVFSSSATISSSGVIILSKPIEFNINNSISKYRPINIGISDLTIKYELSSSLAAQVTENRFNVATVQLTGLTPASGTISKIKCYYKSSGLSDFMFLNDVNVSPIESVQGFTPDKIFFNVTLPTIHRNDKLDFLFEFLNPFGITSKQNLLVKDVLFLGGNTYIAGDDNLMSGSLYVASKLGSGVHISSKEGASMVASIGYRGFREAISTPQTGSAGFLIYSGSVDEIIGATQSYTGVGLEMVANRDSYFRYGTSEGGYLDIKADRFFFGNSTSSIQSVSGSLAFNSPKFTVSTQGVVTASAIYVQKKYNEGVVTKSAVMIDTENGILDATNVGRVLYYDTNEYVISGSGFAAGSFYSGSQLGSNDIKFVFQGLPNEFRYTISYQCKSEVSGGTISRLASRLRVSPFNSGSFPGDTEYTTPYTLNYTTSAASNPNVISTPDGTYTFNSFGAYNEVHRRVDVLYQDQGNLFLGEVDFYIENGSSRTYTSSFKNITVTGTRGMVSSWTSGFLPDEPFSPSQGDILAQEGN